MLMVGAVYAAPLQPVSHVDWMQKSQIVVGDAGGDLALDRAVTLAEAVTFVGRLAGFPNLNATTTNPHWAGGALETAVKLQAITMDQAKLADAPLSSSQIKEIAVKFNVQLNLADGDTVTRKQFLEALGDAATLHITIGHTNDVHGHITENVAGKEFGYAKMATLINEWRKENQNFLLLDAGDTFQGTVYSNQSQGEALIPILNHLNYEAMASGNHEFDFGWEQVIKLKDMLKYPMINANTFKEDGSNLLEPVHYAEIGGKTFAFLGFVAEETPIVTHPDNVKGLTFQNPVEVAKKLVPELKKKADHVIVVSHVGIDMDREIAKNVPGIDLIVGGHSHTPLKTPEVVNGTYIVQDWEYGKSLGRADLYYLGDKLVAFSGGLKEYDESVVADPEVEKLVNVVASDIDENLKAVVAKTDVALDGARDNVRTKETNLGNLLTDIMLKRSKEMPGYEADVAVTNGGGIRDSIAAGDITKKMLYTVFPFPNTLTVVDVTGSDLKIALEGGLSQLEKKGGSFPQISGMSFTYDVKKPVGERIIELKIGDKAYDPEKIYRVATHDFLAAGGDGYDTFKNAKKKMTTTINFFDLMVEELGKMDKVAPKVEGRIVEVK
ncbi:bifunctional metallophosphatase/5'-nucleotidase [Paenibacillus albiflavus]|uniref:Bifunctional metallophosphatase/5'-nucleotidase n=1 Tax=Paenibacillus albiflavus TaxID=2545760 RepID=A0A4R4EKW7_9BACL|nr:5'-nucleotidase C-terminal domain-containing protein [Paenibacillus albiflavus]TCZ78965.1 bifunctional metallophosphatase/5'-nucleotidase [Paenibacillus albiflavus]